jgi:diguanylate cyclase (GGDEF)-like protein/PAS domain S-box-containing protein
MFRIVLAVLAMALLLLGVLVDRFNNERHRIEVRAETHRQLTRMGDELNAKLYADLQLVRGLVGVINLLPELNQAQFDAAVAPLMQGRTQLRNIVAAPDMVIRLVYPMAGNERALGLDYRKTPSQLAAAELARSTGEIIVAGPLALVQGGTGLVIRLPVFVPDGQGGQRFWGLVSAVIDSDRLFQNIGLTNPQAEVEFALRGRDASGPGGPVFVGRPALFDERPEVTDIALPHGSWQLAAAPRAGWPNEANNAWLVRGSLATLAAVILAALAALASSMNRADQAQARAESASAQLSALVDHSPDAMVTVRPDGHIVLVNQRTEELFGWTRHDLLDQPLARLLPPLPGQPAADAWPGYLATLSVAGDDAPSQLTELTGQHLDGSKVAVELSLSPVQTVDGPLVIAVLRDIRSRKAAEARARSSEHRVRVIADNLPVLITYVNAQQVVTFANATWRDFYQIDPEDMTGKHIREALGDRFYEQRRPHIETALREGKRVHYEVLTSDENHGRHLGVTLIPDFDEQGRVVGLYTLGLDVTAQKAHVDLLSSQAHRDPLTGLLNRRGFEKRLAEAAARSHQSRKGLAVLYVDVDHFKQVNDQHGHGVGDRVLVACADRIRDTVRNTDASFRLGGDEFVVLLEGLQQAAEAALVAQKLVETLHQPLVMAEQTMQLSCSIGVAMMLGDASTADTAGLLQRADAALYEAKRSGRDRFVLAPGTPPDTVVG